ncbi:MAG: amino acid ABC transporter permease [Candidatus Hodarchaeota archaeon]
MATLKEPKNSLGKLGITRQDVKSFLLENRPSRYNFGWWLLACLLGLCGIGFIYALLGRIGLIRTSLFGDAWVSYFDPFLTVLNIPLSILNWILAFFGIPGTTIQEGARELIIMRNLADAAIVTLQMSVVSILFGFVIAVVFAVILVRPGNVWGLKWFCQGYIDFFRSTPLLVQMLIIYFGVPDLSMRLGVTFPIGAIQAAILGLSLNTGAYQAEIIRSGIQAIPSGQNEAARGLGMTSGQTMMYVILPQALRIIIPPFTNEGIAVILNSSIAYVVSALELTRVARNLSAYYFITMEIFFLAALFYFVMTFSLASLTKKFELKYRIPGLGLPGDEAGRAGLRKRL